MTTPLPPLDDADTPDPIQRVFGSNPFHTDGDLISVAFRDAQTVWTLEEPGTLRLWDLAQQEQLSWFSLGEAGTAWAFSHDAEFLAGGARDVIVWETAKGEEVATWPQTSWVTAMAFHPEGELLAVAHDSGIIRLWNWRKQTLVFEMVGHPMPVSALAFRHDGQVLASAGEECAIRLWDIERGTMKGSLLGHTDRIPSLAWHPDGRRLISSGWDTTARVWDTQTYEPIILLNSHSGQVHTLGLDAGGSLLACADSDNSIHLWDMDKHRPLDVLRDRAFAEIRCLAFHPSQKCLVFGGLERILQRWDLASGQAPDHEDGETPLQRMHLRTHPDGDRLLSLAGEGPLRSWSLSEGADALLLDEAKLSAFDISPDGKWIVGGFAVESDKERTVPTLGLWDLATGELLDRRVEQGGPVVEVRFAADSKSVATISQHSSDVWTWVLDENEHGPLLAPLLLFNGAVEGCVIESVAWHPDNQRLAIGAVDYLSTSGGDGQVAVWNVSKRSCLCRLEGGALSVAWHPDGRHLVSSTLEGTLRLWDTSQQTLTLELRGHLDIVTCVAYSPDGKWLISASDDHTIRLWDADSGKERGVTEIDTLVKTLAFSADGTQLFTGNVNTSCYQLSLEALGSSS